MKKNDVCHSKYFRAADFPSEPMVLEIETTRLEVMKNDRADVEKLVVYFKRQKSGLPLGPTHWDGFIEATGEEDSKDWPGHFVELYRDKTNFGGRSVACIRARAAKSAPDSDAELDGAI